MGGRETKKYSMNLQFNTDVGKGYKSNAQIAKILTEDWVLRNSYCPECGNLPLIKFENNRPVADFYCKNCTEEFELKSKKNKFSKTVTDGTYSTMIERINSENNPNFFFLTYTKDWTVNDFFIIPKQFFTSEIIIKRPPLANTAKRAGWVGCNIDVSKVTGSGKIFIVKNTQILNRDLVKATFKYILVFKNKESGNKRLDFGHHELPGLHQKRNLYAR